MVVTEGEMDHSSGNVMILNCRRLSGGCQHSLAAIVEILSS